MTRVAAIDCGTNSIRLLIADVSGDELVDVVRDMRIVRLGQGVDRTGRLAPEAIERTGQALAGYTEQIRAHGATKVRMVATSASRDASNAEDFVRMVRAVLGADPEVITGYAEAHLSFVGAVRGLPAATPPYLVADIGGGSTELVLGEVDVASATSVDVGCVRMTERHLHGDPPTAMEIAAAETDIRTAIDRGLDAIGRDAVGRETGGRETGGRDAGGRDAVGRDALTGTLVGLAGSVTTVAALAMGLPEYDSSRIHHSRISYDDVAKVTAGLLAATRTERLALPVMHPGRADVIAAGALVLRILMEQAGATSVIASEHDILDGIAWSLA